MTAPAKARSSKKLDAEVAKLLAEADLARQQAADLAGEQRVTVARARQAEAEAEQAEIAAAELKRSEQRMFASDAFNHVYRFNGPIKAGSVASCIERLTLWDRLEPDCPITVIFNSPGGEVIEGMALWDFLSSLKDRHELTTVANGYAASMAGLLLQVGHIRVMGRESYLMIHELSAGASGKIGEIQDAVKFYEKYGARVINLFVSRSGGKCTKAEFVKNVTRQDWWLSSDEAFKLGFCDVIL